MKDIMKQLSLLALLVLVPISAAAKLNVVATLPDLGAIAEEIGGNNVKVTCLANGMEDPHFVDAKPSFIRVLNRADVLIEGGAELEIGWLPPLVNNARNAKILPNGSADINGSLGVRLLQVPTVSVSRAQGDVHRLGNPHYLLNPDNCRIVAAHIADVFGRLDAAHAADFQANLKQFNERLTKKEVEWKKLMAPYRGTKVVTYHKSFDYLLDYFGLVLVDTIEPKPGIEPSPSHINALVPEAKQAGVKLVIIEPNRPRRTAQRVAEAIGAKLLVLPLMPGGNREAKDFFSWLEYDVTHLSEALNE